MTARTTVPSGGPTTVAPRLVVVSSHAKLGGSELLLEHLVTALRSQVLDVVLLEHGPLSQLLRDQGLPVTVLPVSGRPESAVRGAVRLAGLVRRRKPDVLHANGVKAALVAALAPTRVPIVWMKHDVSFDGRIGRAVARRCARVAGVSTEVLRGLGPAGNTCIVPPGVSVDRLAAQGAARVLRDRLGLRGPVLSVVGRLDPAKGHGELLEVMTRVLEDHPTATALLVGGDDPHHPGHRPALQAAAQRRGLGEHVRLLGHVPAHEVIAASDVVCVPTVPHPDGAGREGFGLVALEAMTLGVPVVGYDVGATAEVLGGCGMLVPEGDRDALGAAIMEVLGDPSVAGRVRDCGRERAAELTTERMVQRLSALYDSVVT